MFQSQIVLFSFNILLFQSISPFCDCFIRAMIVSDCYIRVTDCSIRTSRSFDGFVQCAAIMRSCESIIITSECKHNS